jgi:hypothetical protein
MRILAMVASVDAENEKPGARAGFLGIVEKKKKS